MVKPFDLYNGNFNTGKAVTQKDQQTGNEADWGSKFLPVKNGGTENLSELQKNIWATHCFVIPIF